MLAVVLGRKATIIQAPVQCINEQWQPAYTGCHCYQEIVKWLVISFFVSVAIS